MSSWNKKYKITFHEKNISMLVLVSQKKISIVSSPGALYKEFPLVIGPLVCSWPLLVPFELFSDIIL